LKAVGGKNPDQQRDAADAGERDGIGKVHRVRWQPQAGTNAGTSDTELSSTMNSESNARVNAEGQSPLKRI